MSPEAQRVAIAEACGWFKTERLGLEVFYDPEGGHVLPHELPNYLNDLNAMNEAEKVLIKDRKVTYYATFLCHICESATPMVAVWHATAAQRAEAFLRTIGKWTD